jgi:hypothetical protein
MIIIPGQSGTYRHSRRRFTALLADSGLTDSITSLIDVFPVHTSVDEAAGIPGRPARAVAPLTARPLSVVTT